MATKAIGIEVEYCSKVFSRRLVHQPYFSLSSYLKSCKYLWDKHGENVTIVFYDHTKRTRKSLDDLCAAIALEAKQTREIKQRLYS